MSKSVVLGLVLSLLLGAGIDVRAQWVRTNGPNSGDIHCFATLGSTLFVGTYDAGIYQSTDNGTTWRSIKSYLGGTTVNTLAVSGNFLYAGYDGAGIFRSSDGGQTWESENDGLRNLYVRSLAVDDSMIYAGTLGGLYVSVRSANRWSFMPTEADDSSICAVTASGSSIVIGTSRAGLFNSTDAGATWRRTNATNATVRTLLTQGSTVIAGTGAGEYRSRDGGSNWVKVDSGLHASEVLSLAATANAVYAGTDRGVFRSSDVGLSWSSIHDGLTNDTIVSLLASPATLFAGSQGGGIFRSATGNVSWTSVGIPFTYVYALIQQDSFLFGGTNLGGVYRTSDRGMNWDAVNSGLSDYHVYAFLVRDSELYAATYGGLFRSSDHGDHWSKVGDKQIPPNVLSLAEDGQNLYAGTASGVFRSSDNGLNWTEQDSSFQSTYVISCAVRGNSLFVGTLYGPAYRSDDQAANWTRLVIGSKMNSVRSVVSLGTYLFAGTTEGIFRSTDLGRSWTDTSIALAGIEIQHLFVHDSLFFASTYGRGLFVSSNAGQSWIAMSDGLPDSNIHATVVIGADMYAATSRNSVCRRALLDLRTTATDSRSPTANQLLLMSTADGTRLNLQYLTTTDIDHPILELYDILGKLVFTTTLEPAVSGWNRASCSLPSLPGGTYVCRVTGGGFSASGIVRLGR